jgi:hypothetical protein
VSARYIVLGIGCLFLVAAALRLMNQQWHLTPDVKSWLLIGTIFVAVSVWLLISR